jgi:UDP-glucose:(heptosyl)LPS alpha-1,3-glucosyltransferase
VSGSRTLVLVRRGYSPTGGAEKFLLRFAAAARTRGRQVLLVGDRPWPADVLAGMSQVTLPARGPWAFARAVQLWRASQDGAVVFSLERLLSADCYRAGDGVHAAWLRRRAVYDPAWEAWMRRALPKQRQLLRLESRCFSPRHTGSVIVNSLMVAAEIADGFAYPAERVHLVRNGLPGDFAAALPGRPEARRALGLGDRAFVAAFAGTGWKRKGLRFASAALQAAGIPSAVLAVAGRGPERRHRDPGLVFLGPQADVRPLLAAADVFILPTVYDPFSNACLEALAAGRPVITTRANGCAEILREGVTGSAVAEPHDVTALAAALKFWAGSERASAAERACREAAAACSLDENVRVTLDILDGAAGR